MGIVHTEQGPMKYDASGKLVPAEVSSSSMELQGKKVYNYLEGNLQISMISSELEQFANLAYGGTKFEEPKIVYLPIPLLGQQGVAGVRTIESLPDLKDPFYSFDLSSNTLSVNMGEPRREISSENNNRSRLSLLDRIKSWF